MKNSEKWKPGDLVIFYQLGGNCQIGKVKRVTDDGAFVWYSEGETAAKTPFECMCHLTNGYVILEEQLGGEEGRLCYPDSISRSALLEYLTCKIVEYGEDYGFKDMLLDIREFNINRKRKE